MQANWFRIRVGTGLVLVSLLFAGLAAPRPAAAQEDAGAPDMGKLSFEALTARPSRPLISRAYADEDHGWTRHAGAGRSRQASAHHAASRYVSYRRGSSRHLAMRHAVASRGTRHGGASHHAEFRRVSAVRHLGSAAPRSRPHHR